MMAPIKSPEAQLLIAIQNKQQDKVSSRRRVSSLFAGARAVCLRPSCCMRSPHGRAKRPAAAFVLSIQGIIYMTVRGQISPKICHENTLTHSSKVGGVSRCPHCFSCCPVVAGIRGSLPLHWVGGLERGIFTRAWAGASSRTKTADRILNTVCMVY